MTRRDDSFPFPVERERTQLRPDGTEVPAPALPVPTPGPGLLTSIADALRAAQATAAAGPRPELPPPPATGRYVLHESPAVGAALYRIDTWTGRTWQANLALTPWVWQVIAEPPPAS